MARLNAKQRRALPAKDFAGSGRSFPINDKNHARAALALLHNAPASEQPHIRARAEAMLHGDRKAAHEPKKLEEHGLAPGGHHGGTHGGPNFHEHHPHVSREGVHRHNAEHEIQHHHMAPEPKHSALMPADEGEEGEHYTERHELHHKAHPGEGFKGREGNKTVMRRSPKTNLFT